MKDEFLKQRARLKGLLQHAKRSSPYYGRVLTEPVDAYVESYEAWCEVPILTKELLRDQMEELAGNGLQGAIDLVVQHTSGSTGIPLRIYKDRWNEIRLTQELWKTRMRWLPGIQSLKLLNLYNNVESPHQQSIQIGRDLSIPALQNSIQRIIEAGPEWIKGPPTGVARFAEFCKSHGHEIRGIQLIEVTGEMLLPYQRTLIEDVFGCRVADMYANRELGVLSYECPAGIMHAWNDVNFYEVVRDGKPVREGEEGELIATSFHPSKYMPFVRYKVGDLVRLQTAEKCACGQHTLRLNPTGGRITSLVHLKDKVLLSTLFDRTFSLFIIKNPGTIKEFQVIQEDMNSISIKIVPGDQLQDRHIAQLRRTFFKFLGDVKVDIKFAETLQNASSGKTPTFVSMIPKGELYR